MKELSKEALQLAKEIARAVWSKYDDRFNYRTEKIIKNNSFDDMLPIWQQFDFINQWEFKSRVKTYLEKSTSIQAKEILNWIEEYEAEVGKL